MQHAHTHHTHTHTHMHTHTRTHTCMHACTHTNAHTYKHKDIHIHTIKYSIYTHTSALLSLLDMIDTQTIDAAPRTLKKIYFVLMNFASDIINYITLHTLYSWKL